MPQYSGMWTLSQVSQAVKNQTWTGLPPSVVEYLVVAGGGSGGGDRGAGGGAGGLLTGYVGITPGTSYTVTVGAGGVYSGTYTQGINGSNSIFRDPVSIHVTASGGGGGGAGNGAGNAGTAGSAGGSGGGATGNSGGVRAGGSGISGQGNAGGNSAGTQTCGQGGGGAGTVGLNGISGVQDGSNGGAGIASAISGTVTTYAGGGGGGNHGTAGGGTGGVGGGGSGGNAKPGAVNSGGGGGGNDNTAPSPYNGANGGSGVVIIRYPGTTQFFTGGTLSYANGYMIHTFYANGTLAPTAPTLYANPDYQIARSLRFNKTDQAYLNRTFSVAGNRKTWTQSLWVKRSSLGTQQDLYSPYYGGDGVNESQAFFNSSDQLSIYDSGGEAGYFVYTTTQLFRDLSAWYHIVFACDTTQTTASDRMKIYVNGVQITSFASVQTQTQNTNTGWNDAQLHRIGSYARNTTATLDGYMAEFHNIDGLALTPSSFGWTNPATGVWAPLDYVGSYGTNGFHLNFSDNSNTTAGTLGADSSGNGHNWTPNNFSVSAGVGNDSLVDTPTPYGTDTGVGGEVRGNYATLNPLHLGTASSLTNGSLTFSSTSSSGNIQEAQITGTFGIPSSGKWYFEATPSSLPASIYIGVVSTTHPMSSTPFTGTPIRAYRSSTGNKSNGGTDSAYGNTYTTSDVIGVAVDMDAGSIYFYKNNTVQNSGTAAFTDLAGTTWIPYCVAGSSAATVTGDFNFGQRPFAYTAPTGYKALNTQNLPTPTIGATSTTLAGKYFNTVLWTGNDTARNITGVGFQPDWVWTKFRSAVSNHRLFDVLRGVEKPIYSSATTAEGTETGTLTAFISDGFSLGTNAETNLNGYTFAGWCWKAGGAGVTNTSGSITSSVSASPASGFSIVSFNSTSATGTATIGHGLGAVPSMIIMKNRAYYNWEIYHISSTSTSGRLVFTTSAKLTDANPWNQSAQPVTSSIFGYDQTWNNGANDNIIAYCFAPIAGYSAFGSYTGNGSADGPFVFTGFKPAFLMIKRTDASSNCWLMYDGTRNTSNLTNKKLAANLSVEENEGAQLGGDAVGIDFLSNGFKSVTQTGVNQNASGGSYIYAAFASTPFKYSLAR